MAGHHFSIGLTGGIGSGKSTVTEMFVQRGATIVDTDVIAHHLTAPAGAAIPAIREQFGPDYVLPEGAMNRSKMRELVFTDSQAKTRLESILHPLIRDHAEAEAARATDCYVIFAVPLLIESGRWKERVDRILVIDCPEELQIQRVSQRSGLTEPQVRAIMATQVSRSQRIAAADDILPNNGDKSALKQQVDRLHALYSDLARTNSNK